MNALCLNYLLSFLAVLQFFSLSFLTHFTLFPFVPVLPTYLHGQSIFVLLCNHLSTYLLRISLSRRTTLQFEMSVFLCLTVAIFYLLKFLIQLPKFLQLYFLNRYKMYRADVRTGCKAVRLFHTVQNKLSRCWLIYMYRRTRLLT